MTTRRSEFVHRLAYVSISVALLLSQNLVAWFARRSYSVEEPIDLEFWFAPLRSALKLFDLPAMWGAAIFAYSLLVAWALAVLSFKMAQRTNRGFVLAVLSVVPVVQVVAIVLNASLPASAVTRDETLSQHRAAHGVTMGLLAGVALIVLAVLISAVTFGAYGWGLFVMTPFLVGITTGYLVNLNSDLGARQTMKLVIQAAGLGSLALVVLALEGIVCIALAAPLAVPIVMMGGALGRWIAIARLNRRNPLASVAILPIIFMAEGAIPPDAPIATHFEIEIGASPDRVWQALTSPEPIKVAPGLPALVGLAYPINGTLAGEGVGARRIGAFSTGTARERVTVWEPAKALAFRVDQQPPAMEEMSPYRRVHAPHLEGYFETGETRFDLRPLPNQRTVLRVTSSHRLRIDPVPYWAPIARLAIRQNVDRVLQDIKEKSEFQGQ